MPNRSGLKKVAWTSDQGYGSVFEVTRIYQLVNPSNLDRRSITLNAFFLFANLDHRSITLNKRP